MTAVDNALAARFQTPEFGDDVIRLQAELCNTWRARAFKALTGRRVLWLHARHILEEIERAFQKPEMSRSQLYRSGKSRKAFRAEVAARVKERHTNLVATDEVLQGAPLAEAIQDAELVTAYHAIPMWLIMFLVKIAIQWWISR